MQKTKAFSLIELLVVVAIIGIIIGFGILSSGPTKARAYRSNYDKIIQMVSSNLQAYYQMHGIAQDPATGEFPQLTTEQMDDFASYMTAGNQSGGREMFYTTASWPSAWGSYPSGARSILSGLPGFNKGAGNMYMILDVPPVIMLDGNVLERP